MQKKHIAAIILSAGYASRMGRLKPMLPLGTGTVIGQTIQCFQAADVARIVVVLGHRADDIIPLLNDIGVDWVINQRFREGMLTSVCKGIESLAPDIEAFFIMPADIPLVRPVTLKMLVEAHGRHSSGVIYPLFNGQMGHPPLIPTSHAEGILKWGGKEGLKGYLKSWGGPSVNVETADEGVLMDMDTPEDYKKVLTRSKQMDIPSRMEAMTMLNLVRKNDRALIAHSKAVARTAGRIGAFLNEAGEKMDLDLMAAAGLLHDIAKGEPEHAQKGADLLAEKGFERVADIVRSHMNIVFDPADGIGEKEIVCLADKMLSGADILPLEKRLQDKIEKLSGNAVAVEMATVRMQNAIRIRSEIEDILGISLEEVLKESTQSREKR